MWNAIIRWSLRHRLTVLGLAGLLVAAGAWTTRRLPVDVLPDITAPTVTVITEAHGMAPDEVERLVTLPIETALNGAPGLRRLRSSSGTGIAIVWAEFEWDVDPFRARQVVAERLQVAGRRLPRGVEAPLLAPMSSVMGEIMFLGVTGEAGADPMRLRHVAERQIRRRLLGVTGVAQVTPIGGEVKQVQVVLDPDALRRLRIGVRQVLDALEAASRNAPGGFYVSGHHEYLIRALGRVDTLDGLTSVVIARRDGAPITLGSVAEVRIGAALKRGTAAIDGRPAVVLAVQKQPHANTLTLTERIDAALDEIAGALPEGVRLYRKGFRQAHFIELAIDNVTRHIVESVVLVVLILAVFLANWRTTLISVVALPLSLLAGLLVLFLIGGSINTMTLGGFAIAIGALVDDAIIDVENVYRRLRQRASMPPEARPPIVDVVFSASAEIRNSIVYATAVIVLVFLPLFFLDGLEGRLMRPLGTAYVVSLAASLLVAVTVTPALCALLLRDVPPPAARPESVVVRAVRRLYAPALSGALRWPRTVVALSALGVAASVALIATFGRGFLPAFNEGSYTLAAATVPGTSLAISDEMAGRLDRALLDLGFVTSVVRRTGRAEGDEHAQDVQFSELEVTVDPAFAEAHGQAEIARRIREAAAGVPGLVVTVGQPIGHRIEHMLSGVKTSIAIKVFGPELPTLRALARRVASAMAGVEGIVDLAVEPQTDIPQLHVRPDLPMLARLGLTPGELAAAVEVAFHGHPVAQWWEGAAAYDVVVRYPDAHRADLEAIARSPVDAGGERFATLGQVARLDRTLGPNVINREDVQRRIVVMANVAGRDVRGVIDDVRARLERDVPMPEGYYVEYGGEFESEARASRTIGLLSIGVLMVMAGLLWTAFGSLRDALLVMVNLPLSLMGGAIAVWVTGAELSVPSLLGFITLFGIATRNGIMLVTHYRHLMTVEGASFAEAVERGSMERLVPVLMTALGTGLALVPIALALGEPGNEIQAPMALVILGGLVSSTLLNMVALPALYRQFGAGRRATAAG